MTCPRPLSAELERSRDARSHRRRYRLNTLRETTEYQAASLEAKERMSSEVEVDVETLYRERRSKVYNKFLEPVESAAMSSSVAVSSTCKQNNIPTIVADTVLVKTFFTGGVQTTPPEQELIANGVCEVQQTEFDENGNSIENLYNFDASDDGDDSSLIGDSSGEDGEEIIVSECLSQILVNKGESLLEGLTSEAENRE